ncbi:MAG: MMPL family transporter [Solirubrobacterales bacterium]
MRRAAALLWLAVVAVAAVHLAVVSRHGLPMQTDLMALLPVEERDPQMAEAKAAVSRQVSQRVVILVGHEDPARARQAAAGLRDALVTDGVLDPAGDVPAADALKRLGEVMFAHRAGLLSRADRAALAEGRVDELGQRALSQLYGVGGIADAKLLSADPLLTFPAFLADLPIPSSRFALVEGWPTVKDAGVSWVLVSGRLSGDAFALADQERFVDAYERAVEYLPGTGVRLVRLGAVFYAHAGASEAIAETSLVGTVATIGTIALILLVFRSAGPLLLTVAATLAGMAAAFSVSLLWFGELHVIAMTFGASLIGVAVDYGLHYSSQVFADRPDPRQRLAHVLPGIVMGLLTTLIGYGALALSPLPGLRQVALFSAVGLIATFLSVVLWFPLCDRARPRRLPPALAAVALSLWRLWDRPDLAGTRRALAAVLLALSAAGALLGRADDDVRRQQDLNPALVAEQVEVQRLMGLASSTQFFLVSAADDETALQREEELAERLVALKRDGAVAAWRSPAGFVPSAKRQRADAALVAERVEPALPAFRASLGLAEASVPATASHPLLPADVVATGALPLLPALMLAPGSHVVALDGASDLAALRGAAEGLDGVRFVDPTGDLTVLLGVYRWRAMALLAVSALLMLPLLALRYGWLGAVRVMLPPVSAVVATPLLLALVGLPFTFFSSMALMLVLSIGVDFAVFCAEDDGRRDVVTVLATCLATMTTALSFGMLAFSHVAGVRSFGAVMLVGMGLAFLLAPSAGNVRARRRGRA